MGIFNVSAAIGPLNGGVIAVGALEITHSMSVHHSLVGSEFLRCSEERGAILASQRHIDVASSIMSLPLLLLAKGFFASFVLANKIALRFRVDQLMSLESVLSDRRIIAMRTLQNGLGARADLMRRIQVVEKGVLLISPEIATLLNAVVPLRFPVLAAHVILEAG